MYTPHKWESREIIFATLLNNMENGIQQNSENLKDEANARSEAVNAEKSRAENVERNLILKVRELEAYKHTHPNKAVIDNITQADIDYWNSGGGGGGESTLQIRQILEAGETTVEMAASMIADASRIELYTSTGIAPLSQSVSGNTYIAVFEEQEEDVEVMIEVRANVENT